MDMCSDTKLDGKYMNRHNTGHRGLFVWVLSQIGNILAVTTHEKEGYMYGYTGHIGLYVWVPSQIQNILADTTQDIESYMCGY